MAVTARARPVTPTLPRIQRYVGLGLQYAMLIFLSAVFILPFIWMVSTAFKHPQDAVTYPPELLPPLNKITLYNFTYFFERFPYLNALKNTMLIVIGVEVGRLLSASLVAFAFARLRFRHKEKLFLLILSTMMVPYHVTLVPQYLAFSAIGWTDTFYPLIIPAFFGGGAFFIFLLRQFFMSIPMDYDDAARIDGAGVLGIFWRIILPLSKPALGVVAIFTFMHEWNDFFAPIIYLNSRQNQTLSIVLMEWQRLGDVPVLPRPWSAVICATLLLTLPPIILFFVAQRNFIQGVVISGVKG